MTFDQAYWDAHYAAAPGSAHDVSPHLVAAVHGRQPGTALDAGCGPGTDARWLASQGWTVTAVDVAAAAIEQARAVPSTVTWEVRDLTTWSPPAAFDLVTSHYVHVPGSFADLVRRLAAAVRPGGLLLVVGHDPHHDGGHAAGSHLDLDAAAAVLDAGWTVFAQDRRPRPTATGPLRDVVLLAHHRA